MLIKLSSCSAVTWCLLPQTVSNVVTSGVTLALWQNSSQHLSPHTCLCVCLFIYIWLWCAFKTTTIKLKMSIFLLVNPTNKSITLLPHRPNSWFLILTFIFKSQKLVNKMKITLQLQKKAAIWTSQYIPAFFFLHSCTFDRFKGKHTDVCECATPPLSSLMYAEVPSWFGTLFLCLCVMPPTPA